MPPLHLWTYDLAREQCPTPDHLRRFLGATREAGYDGIGLYLEHRFAYPSAPWAHGRGSLTPQTARLLQDEFPEVQIIPFLNLLGHFEGFLSTAEGARLAEGDLRGSQACPSNPEFVALCGALIRDTIAAFDSEIVHLGGDETAQLGECPRCAARVRELENSTGDGRAALYGEHFGALARKVLAAGRRPALWADMVLAHPVALKDLPKETLLFDWQYFSGCKESASRLMQAGFDVVCCPTLHVYNAVWMHLPESETNVRSVALDASEIGASGVCLTTWEGALFGAYDTLLPAVRAVGTALSSGEMADLEAAYRAESKAYGNWAMLMGSDLQKCGSAFAFSRTRNSLKRRLLGHSNPFLAWKRHASEFRGEQGDEALAILETARLTAPDEATLGVATFARSAVKFVRFADAAAEAYSRKRPNEAIAALAPALEIFEELETIAQSARVRIGGSLADVERCRIAKARVESAIRRLGDYGDGSLGYLPAFELLAHPGFVPHDQGSWWAKEKGLEP